MALPRSIEDSNKRMRTAAIERLRSDFGVRLSKHDRSSTRIADAIRQVDPSLEVADPMLLIRAWVAVKPSEAVPGRQITETGRPYTLDAHMRQAVQRASHQPPLIAMSSSVLYSPEVTG